MKVKIPKILFISLSIIACYGFSVEKEIDNKPNTIGYSEERILFLIDSVLNLKNPPKWVLLELQNLINSKKSYNYFEKTQEKSLVNKNSLSTHQNDEENNYFLNCWGDKKIQIFPDSIIKADTGTVINFYERPFCIPFTGKITSPFGYREGKYHKGIDINLNIGNPIVASFSGIVRMARFYGNFGNVVIIRHWGGLETVYAHLSKLKIKAGQKVEAGQVIGLGGNTGRSSGPHLHFEIRYLGQPINPQQLISFEEQRLKYPVVIFKKNKIGYSALPQGSVFYKVKPGDSWVKIAQKNGLSIKHLKQLNGINPNSKSILQVGQVIRLS
jgi:LysM repeat protein